MVTDLDGFLTALSAFIAGQAALPQAVGQADLFLYTLTERDSKLAAAPPGPASVISVYDATTPYPTPVGEASCQIRTIGVLGQDEAAIQRAQAIHGTLSDADSRPLRMQPLPATGTPAWRINGIIDLRGPSMIGRDEPGRLLIVSNFTAAFVKL